MFERNTEFCREPSPTGLSIPISQFYDLDCPPGDELIKRILHFLEERSCLSL